MTELEHSPVNRADEGEARDQSGGVPRTPARLDRDRTRAVVTGIARGDYDRADDAVDALEASVIPAPPQALDRAALIEVLRGAIPPRMTEGYYARVADRILALVRPVEGVTLTVGEIQHIWIVLIWARDRGFGQTSFDDQYLHAAEAKLQAMFDAHIALEASA